MSDACDLAPLPLEPPFVSPEVAWQRISLMVVGEVIEPPSPLPSEVTVEWAGAIALEAFDAARRDSGAPSGMRAFIATWLRFESEAPLVSDWAELASQDDATLDTLVGTPAAAEPERIGVFSDVRWLSRSSGISQRGHGIAAALVGPPGPAHADSGPWYEPGPGETRRDAHSAFVSALVCQGCHSYFDPLGFSLEHFDALGNYRTTDNGLPVDTSGSILVDEQEVSFDSIVDLAPQLAASCRAAKRVSELYLQQALTRAGVWSEGALLDSYEVERVTHAFVDEQRSMRSLVRSSAQVAYVMR